MMNDKTMMIDEYHVIWINQCLCMPKAELNTKISTRWQLCRYLVEFLVFNSTTHAEERRGLDDAVLFHVVNSKSSWIESYSPQF